MAQVGGVSLGNAMYVFNEKNELKRVRNIRHKLNEEPFIRSRKLTYITGLSLHLDGNDFTNNPPSTVWKDRSPNGYNFIPINFLYTSTNGSDGNGGIVFDGTNVLSIDNPSYLNITNAPLILDCTFIPHTLDNSRVIVGNMESAGYAIEIGAGETTAEIELYRLRICCNAHINGAYRNIYSNDQIVVGKEYKVRFIYDGKQMKMFVNGVLQDNTLNISGSIKASTAKFSIGANHSSGSKYDEWFHGIVKEVKIYHNANTKRVNL